MISIIIPTLNEEKYLPLLLESIKKQDINDCEIIVSDAGSEDKTLEIAKKYNCKIVKGGLPAKGRNNGAKAAKGDLFLFLDADIILPRKTFSGALKEFRQRKLDMATFCLFPSEGNKISSLFFALFYNFPIILLEKVLPHAAMGILIKKDFFNKLNGFDESIKVGEDNNLARRAKKLGKFGVFRSVKIFFSTRRFNKDGWLKTSLMDLLSELYSIFIGPIRSNIFKYEFNHYNKKDLKEKKSFSTLYNKYFIGLKWGRKAKNK